MNLRLSFCLVVALLLSACVSAPQSAALRRQAAPELLEPALLTQVPFFPQDAYQCGPAALATMLVASQVAVTPEQLVPLVYVPERKGSFQVEMMAAARSHGRLAYRLAPSLTALFTEVSAGNPVLVLQNLGLAVYPRWHFAVVKGFDLERRKVLLNSGTYENYETSLATFERTWARAEHWGMLTLAPGTLPATAEPTAYFTALAALEETHPEAAIELAYESGLQAWPQDRDLLMGYGNVLYEGEDAVGAAEQFGKVKALYPDYAPAWNNLAQVLWEQGDAGQALFHSRRAVALGGPFLATYRATLLTIETGAP
jgi:tetratricopeptide (TPR) repeat protein